MRRVLPHTSILVYRRGRKEDTTVEAFFHAGDHHLETPFCVHHQEHTEPVTYPVMSSDSETTELAPRPAQVHDDRLRVQPLDLLSALALDEELADMLARERNSRQHPSDPLSTPPTPVPTSPSPVPSLSPSLPQSPSFHTFSASASEAGKEEGPEVDDTLRQATAPQNECVQNSAAQLLQRDSTSCSAAQPHQSDATSVSADQLRRSHSGVSPDVPITTAQNSQKPKISGSAPAQVPENCITTAPADKRQPGEVTTNTVAATCVTSPSPAIANPVDVTKREKDFPEKVGNKYTEPTTPPVREPSVEPHTPDEMRDANSSAASTPSRPSRKCKETAARRITESYRTNRTNSQASSPPPSPTSSLPRNERRAAQASSTAAHTRRKATRHTSADKQPQGGGSKTADKSGCEASPTGEDITRRPPSRNTQVGGSSNIRRTPDAPTTKRKLQLEDEAPETVLASPAHLQAPVPCPQPPATANQPARSAAESSGRTLTDPLVTTTVTASAQHGIGRSSNISQSGDASEQGRAQQATEASGGTKNSIKTSQVHGLANAPPTCATSPQLKATNTTTSDTPMVDNAHATGTSTTGTAAGTGDAAGAAATTTTGGAATGGATGGAPQLPNDIPITQIPLVPLPGPATVARTWPELRPTPGTWTQDDRHIRDPNPSLDLNRLGDEHAWQTFPIFELNLHRFVVNAENRRPDTARWYELYQRRGRAFIQTLWINSIRDVLLFNLRDGMIGRWWNGFHTRPGFQAEAALRGTHGIFAPRDSIEVGFDNVERLQELYPSDFYWYEPRFFPSHVPVPTPPSVYYFPSLPPTLPALVARSGVRDLVSKWTERAVRSLR